MAKQFHVSDRVRANFQALLLSVLNHSAYLVGNTGGATLSIDSTTFGQTTNMGAGPRAVVLRFQVTY